MATQRQKKKSRAETQGNVTQSPSGGAFQFLQNLSTGRAIGLIFLCSLLAYANSLGGEFVFDDTDQIVQNQNVRSWDNLGKAFTTDVWAFRERSGNLNVPPPLPYYRPLFTVMLTVEYQIFGLWPQGWHLVSLLLHILCAVGVFYIVLLMSRQRLIALFTSIVFAVHPVHAESVSWISGMTDPLFGIFFLASFYFYLKAGSSEETASERTRALLLSLGAFVLSCFAKETALSLIILLFGYELVTQKARGVDRWTSAAKRALPYVAAAFIYLLPRYLVLKEMMWKNPQAPDRPAIYTLLTLPFVVCSYLFHLVWPIGLSVNYDTHFVTSAGSREFLLPFGLLSIGASALFIFRKRISVDVWKSLLLIFVPLLPVLNLGQISQEAYLVFDHYLYISVAGLGYLVAVGVLRLASSKSKESEATESTLGAPNRGVLATAAFALLTVLLVAGTALANRAWIDSYALWSNVARVRPAYWAAHYNAGLVLLDANRFGEARSLFETANRLNPTEPNVLVALGRSYDGTGETSSAVTSFKRAIEISPDTFESYNGLGGVYFNSGDYRLAEAAFQSAVRLNPQSLPARFNLGLCYSRQGRYSDATRELEQVTQISPGDDLALYELGLVYEKAGRNADAVRVFQSASNLTKSKDLADKLAAGLSRLRGDVHRP